MRWRAAGRDRRTTHVPRAPWQEIPTWAAGNVRPYGRAGAQVLVGGSRGG